MSTTTDLAVAVRYALSRRSLLSRSAAKPAQLQGHSPDAVHAGPQERVFVLYGVCIDCVYVVFVSVHV